MFPIPAPVPSDAGAASGNTDTTVLHLIQSAERRTEQKRGFRPQEWHYRWDDFDRLSEIKTPDGEVWQYSYDAFGRRTAKRCVIRAAWKRNHHAVSEVRYQWLGMALSTSEKRYADGSPALREQWYYRGSFELLAKESRAANDDRSHFYPIVTGPDGAPQEMYSANGQKVWTKHRTLWGLAANDSLDSERESCDAGFMGQWQDEESGLWYNLHRYYDAGTGQYLSPDPLKLAGGLNTQSYVHDPVGWCDPWGLAGEKCPTQMKIIIEEDLAAKKGDALKGKQAEAYDAIKNMLSRGESGKNQHSLHGDLKGKSAADLHGSGKGRGGDRVLYSETENEVIIHDIVDYHKK